VQRSIQRRRQQQKSLDSFLINFNNDNYTFDEENLNKIDIDILYRSIEDNSLLHITELQHNQILVLTCENEDIYRNKLANASVWLCTTFNEVKKETFYSIAVDFKQSSKHV
jgi:hypothetical protein